MRPSKQEVAGGYFFIAFYFIQKCHKVMWAMKVSCWFFAEISPMQEKVDGTEYMLCYTFSATVSSTPSF